MEQFWVKAKRGTAQAEEVKLNHVANMSTSTGLKGSKKGLEENENTYQEVESSILKKD